jgi:hypothetical protein
MVVITGRGPLPLVPPVLVPDEPPVLVPDEPPVLVPDEPLVPPVPSSASLSEPFAPHARAETAMNPQPKTFT